MVLSGTSKFARQVRRCGGVGMFAQMYLRNNFAWFWNGLEKLPLIGPRMNNFNTALLIRAYSRNIPRVNKFTLRDDFASLESAYDDSRTMYSKVVHSDIAYGKRLNEHDPDANLAAGCFKRDVFKPEPHQNLSLLIGYYAQWFSHQFFNTVPQKEITNPDGTHKGWDYSPTVYTNQPVGLNLGQLYGSFYDSTEQQEFGTLKEKSLRTKEHGLLKSSLIHDKQFPEIVKADGVRNLKKFPFWDADKGSNEAFAMPVALANMVPGFAAMQTLFLRHHNYIAGELANANPGWSDERLFQTSKLINMLTVLKVTMNDYVANALQTSNVKLHFDLDVKNSMFWKLMVPRSFESINAIQQEFNLLYRWHQFYPNEVRILKDLNGNVNNKGEYNILEFPSIDKSSLNHWNSVDYFKGRIDDPNWDYIENSNKDGKNALELLLLSCAQQRAGQLTLKNTHPWLAGHVVRSGLLKGRSYGLASYNDYREYFGFGRLSNFEDISSDPEILRALKQAYKTTDDIEFYAGIFAEDKDFGGIHGPFLATIGVGFTFCGIFSSRVYNGQVFDEKLLSNRGLEIVNDIDQLRDVIKLHTELGQSDLWKQLTFRMSEEKLKAVENATAPYVRNY